jgi:uncharacterized protein YfaS (alpha-2-macroglobulin family)
MTDPSTYQVQQRVRLSAIFRDDMTPVDPTAVSFKVKNPTGTTTTYSGGSVIKDSTGKYHVDIDLNDDGLWYYRVEGTGAAVGADEHVLVVAPSQFY